jgi:hypothetical protein
MQQTTQQYSIFCDNFQPVSFETPNELYFIACCENCGLVISNTFAQDVALLMLVRRHKNETFHIPEDKFLL